MSTIAATPQAIIAHYESCVRQHGSGARASDWRSEADALRRYDVMLDLVSDPGRPATLLDFGCGLGALAGHMRRQGLVALAYTGLEISSEIAAEARIASPGLAILCMDVLAADARLPTYDYIVMNGIFTRRETLSESAMQNYFERLLTVVFASCGKGLAFNVMSKAVDYEREVLFHPDPGTTFAFLTSKLSRHVVMRNDYGLHETTWYLYRDPIRTPWRTRT